MVYSASHSDTHCDFGDQELQLAALEELKAAVVVKKKISKSYVIQMPRAGIFTLLPRFWETVVFFLCHQNPGKLSEFGDHKKAFGSHKWSQIYEVFFFSLMRLQSLHLIVFQAFEFCKYLSIFFFAFLALLIALVIEHHRVPIFSKV